MKTDYYSWRLNMELMDTPKTKTRHMNEAPDAWTGVFHSLSEAMKWAEEHGKTTWSKYPLILYRNGAKTETVINH